MVSKKLMLQCEFDEAPPLTVQVMIKQAQKHGQYSTLLDWCTSRGKGYVMKTVQSRLPASACEISSSFGKESARTGFAGPVELADLFAEFSAFSKIRHVAGRQEKRGTLVGCPRSTGGRKTSVAFSAPEFNEEGFWSQRTATHRTAPSDALSQRCYCMIWSLRGGRVRAGGLRGSACFSLNGCQRQC